MAAASNKIESGFQLFTRVRQAGSLQNLHPVLLPDPQPNDIVQITGESSTGKTLLVMELIARCILPSKHQDVVLPGKEVSAAFINTDHHFSIFKLAAVMESLLTGVQLQFVQQIIKASLKRLIILNCFSSEELRLTFQNLDRVLGDNIGINFLAIDGILQYYWYDRAREKASSINMYCVGLLNELKKVIHDRNIVTVFTKHEAETFIKALNSLLSSTVLLKKKENCFSAVVYDHAINTSFCKDYRIETNFVFLDGS